MHIALKILQEEISTRNAEIQTYKDFLYSINSPELAKAAEEYMRKHMGECLVRNQNVNSVTPIHTFFINLIKDGQDK